MSYLRLIYLLIFSLFSCFNFLPFYLWLSADVPYVKEISYITSKI